MILDITDPTYTTPIERRRQVIATGAWIDKGRTKKERQRRLEMARGQRADQTKGGIHPAFRRLPR
jgi:hypothetical protein